MAQWLRCCATNRKVTDSIPDGVIGIFHWYNPGTFPGGKDGRCVRLTTLPPSCAIVMKSGNLNLLELSGPLRACNGTDLPLYVLLSDQECDVLIRST